MAPSITQAERQEASRRLDEHHQAQLDEEGPFCTVCPFYASVLDDTPKHSTISGVEVIDRWVAKHPKEG